MTSALLFPSEFAAPGDANVRSALFAAPVLALMVPPLSVSADVPVQFRQLELPPLLHDLCEVEGRRSRP